MIIGLTLSILIVLTLFSLILGNVFVNITYNIGIDSTATTETGAKTFEVELGAFTFEIDPVFGMIVIFFVVIAIAAIIGIQVLASGLSPESIRFIMNAILYFGIWSLLSAISAPLIFGIELFGTLIYITLTIGYVIGVIQKQTGGSA